MFGDWEWLSERSDVQEAQYRQWLRDIRGSRLAVVEVGAGLGVPTVRHECERVVQGHQGRSHLIRINPSEQQLSVLSQALVVKDKLEAKGVVQV